MHKGIEKALAGKQLWDQIKTENHISDSTVVIVLPESDEIWNRCAYRYLPFFMKRKGAAEAQIIVSEMGSGSDVELSKEYHTIVIDDEHIRLLMDYYLLHRFFDNIVFFYKDHPRDNHASQMVEKGYVTVEEIICYGFYRLREVPIDV